MCRNIKTLFNFEPPASPDEVRASALQFVRKLSGYTHPSQANQAAFEHAVDEVTAAARKLLDALETTSPPRNREVEAAKARERAKLRYPLPQAPAADAGRGKKRARVPA
ncbi:MAG TPA: DUF2277 domain-containing protein [Devosiaceae bacterium]|nr:DUF2277 domain-containing protein [Devosiaceae bacterium]